MPPRLRWMAIPCGGVLDESPTPSRVGGNGGSGLTDCLNHIYQRNGSWGKRSGSALAYAPTGPGGAWSNPKTTGVRWYRSSPSPLTQLVVSAQGALWTGNDATGQLTKIYDFTQNPDSRIRFASVYDPQANLGSGGDILVICGATTNEGFATGGYYFTGIMGVNPSARILVTINGFAVPDLNGSAAQTYKPLQTDNIVTIAQAIATQINNCKLVQPDPSVPTTPVLGSAYVTEITHPSSNQPVAILHLGALQSGTGGNSITIAVSTPDSGGNGFGTGATLAIGTGSASHLSGGGAQVSAPLKYDGVSVSGLSYQIQHNFKNCATWHDHLWLWGDPSFLNNLYACDIDQPEGFTFMAQNGPYKIGVGDGDPAIKTCKPWGNSLAVFKTNNIYQVSGYDFQTGEYQFQVQPLVTADENSEGSGIPDPDCVAELGAALVYWDGRRFNRLAVGAYLPEPIGKPLPITSGMMRIGKQSLVQAVAGSFQELTSLNNTYSGGGSDINVMRPNRALWAVDLDGNGIPDSVIVYDDDATSEIGRYAWMKWGGLPVASWIPFGSGPNASDTDTDPPYLYFLLYSASGSPSVYRLGGAVGDDLGDNPIPWMVQTGWVNLGTPELPKNLHRIFIELQSTAGANIVASVTPAATNIPGQRSQQPSAAAAFDAAQAPAGGEAYNVILQVVEPQLKTPAFLFRFTEDGTSEAQFELVTYNLDMIEEALQP